MDHAFSVTRRISALGLQLQQQQQHASPFPLRWTVAANGWVLATSLTATRAHGACSFDTPRRASNLTCAAVGNAVLAAGPERCVKAPKGGLGWGYQGFLGRRIAAHAARAARPRGFATRTPGFGNLTEREYQKHRPKNLAYAELKRIFGSGAQLANGNNTLQILQKQRLTGTLDQEVALPGYTDAHLAKGLRWLRANYPIDEDAAIARRIEAEEGELEKKYIADIEKAREYRPQDSAQEHGIYGKSELDELRAYNRAMNKRMEQEQEAAAAAKEAKEREAAEAGSDDAAMLQHPSGRAVLARRSEEPEWVKKYKAKAKLSEHFTPPEMSKTRRLLPAALFAATAIGACVLFAQNYKPPPAQARLFPDIPPAGATIGGIVLLNVAAFLMWRAPPLWRFMNKYFLVIAATPRAASMLGNIFSHQSFSHLLTNMVVLWWVGPKLHDQIGRGNFVAVYLSCGVFASFMSLSRFVLMGQLIQSSLGASGAILGMVSCYLALNSGSRFSFVWWPFGGKSPEFSPVALLLCFAAVELLGIYRKSMRFDHYAHLAGLVSGVASAEVLKYRARLRRTARSVRKVV